MSDTATAVAEETEDERKARKKAERAELIADAATAAVKAMDEAAAKVVLPQNRPDFDTADPESGSPLPISLKSATTERLHPRGESKIVHFPLTPGGLRNHNSDAGENAGRLIDAAIDKHIAINRFPRDFDAGDFSMARYAMAEEQARNTHLGNLAYQKIAPKERAFYEALAYYSKESKALGEMTSGQDGGFLAPEIWTNVFSFSGNAVR